MRVVVDTNILVSFAIRPNTNFEKIFDHIAAQGVTLVSEDTLAATRRTTSFLPSHWRERPIVLSPATAIFSRWSRSAALPSTAPRISYGCSFDSRENVIPRLDPGVCVPPLGDGWPEI